MKTGLAAQSTANFSREQSADSTSASANSSEKKRNPVSVTQAPTRNKNAEIDPGRANSPVLNPGKSTSQSSVVNSLPKTAEKVDDTKSKRMPWEQQSAQVATDSTNSQAKDSNKESSLPWQQQSSAKADDSEINNNEPKSKDRLPVSQQSAAQTSGSASNDPNKAGTMPWQQQTSAKTDSGDSQVSENTDNSSTNSESKIRRVVIDPVTGLYIETSLSSVNNAASGSKNMSFENRQEDLLEWPFWEMTGRIGLTVSKDSYNGSVSWDQNGEAIDFRFRGPLGIGGVRIHGDLDEQVRVKTTTGQDFTVSDFETEMQARMGWSIPINSLRYWALGIVDPEVDADVVLNDADLLEELVQGNWKVVYERYQEVDGVDLPKKFKITGPDTRIKMVVNDWTIPGSE